MSYRKTALAAALSGAVVTAPLHVLAGAVPSGFFDGVRTALDAKLTDYTTARFMDVRMAHNDKGPFLCGLVNSKDSSGNYTGWVRFTAWAGDGKSDGVAILETDSVTGSVVRDGACTWRRTKFDRGDFSGRVSYRIAKALR